MVSRAAPPNAALLCFCQLRWDFVYQRPQHLMSRIARQRPVFFIEEPLPFDGKPYLERRRVASGVQVLVPRLPTAHCAPGHETGEAQQRGLLGQWLREQRIRRPLLWFYTPMSVVLTPQLQASQTVYDCMDQLSAFAGAPPQMAAREAELLARADVVFTGGHSLYEAKRRLHPHVYEFASSVDVPHFAQARQVQADPPELSALPPGPRLGFHGVIDERFDSALVAEAAALRPDWQWLFVGPVVKIRPESLPQAPNIHWLGPRPYAELPAHVGRWDLAVMPFAINEATRYISPTKTPEYLAAGCAVVSTPVNDVVRAWGDCGLVRIASDAAGFVQAIAATLAQQPARSPAVCAAADRALRGLSWDNTCRAMLERLREREQALAAAAGPEGAALRHGGGEAGTAAAWAS